jgi:hypothetical protein
MERDRHRERMRRKMEEEKTETGKEIKNEQA